MVDHCVLYWRSNCVHRYSDKDKDHASGECHFMNGTNRAAVALVSFPGSGNTWVRGLLRQATGVCTGGSCDVHLCDDHLMHIIIM